MIKKEDYLIAKGTVDEYNRQLNAKQIKEYTCCVCKKEKIKPMHPESINPLKQECGAWLNGAIDKISVGYGSIHDMSSFYIAICDKCLTDLHDKGVIVHYRKLLKELDKNE